MGYRQAAVLVSVSFFLGEYRFATYAHQASAIGTALTRPHLACGPLSGVLAVCMNVDYRILFTPLTEATIRDGFEFYTTFFNAPPAIKVRLLEPPLLFRRRADTRDAPRFLFCSAFSASSCHCAALGVGTYAMCRRCCMPSSLWG